MAESARRDGGPAEGAPDPSADSWSVFGDPVGLGVFLGALAAVGATWQVGVFITDTYAVANGLVNLADGHLAVERVHYSLTLGSQPGLSAVDGNLYARNYGQAFLALPVYYALQTLAGVVDLHLLLVAAWALVLAAWCRQLGTLTDRRGEFTTAGSTLGALLVVGSVPLVEPVDDGQVGLLALQVVSMLAVAVTALALYRLVTVVRSRQVGGAVGVAAVVATPLWFWASVPKRHALTAAAVATLLFWFAASREPSGRVRLPVVGSVPRALALRVAGYLLVGLVAWVHAFEGVLLFGAFAVSDLATASGTSRRALLAVTVAAAAGFAPFVATNLAVTGNPVEPPRVAPHYLSADDEYAIGPDGIVVGPDDRQAGPDGSGGSDGSDGDGTPDTSTSEERSDSDAPRSRDPFATAAGFAEQVASHGEKILDATGSAPRRLLRTYVRSGRADELTSYDVNDEEVIDLSLLESNPLLGGLAGALVGVVGSAAAGIGRRLGAGRRRLRRPTVPARQWHCRVRNASARSATDGFAVVVVVGFGLMYFPLLPLFSQLTVRYLLPTVPALLYLLARVPAVAGTVERRPRWLAGGYAGSTVAGLLGVAFVVPRLDPAVGEAMQLHGLVNLGVAAVVAASLLATRFGPDDARVRAVALALAGGATTVLVVAMQLAYFEYGTYALPAVRLVADAVVVV